MPSIYCNDEWYIVNKYINWDVYSGFEGQTDSYIH